MDIGTQHFRTNNKQLAFALITAGCQYAPQEDGGPVIMNYTPELLRKKWLNGKRVLPLEPTSEDRFEEACKIAYEAGISGNIYYLIVKDAIFDAAVKKWDAMEEEFVRAEKEGRAPVVPKISTETTMAVLFLRNANEEAADKADIAFLNAPICLIEHSKTTSEPLPSRDGLPSPGNRDTKTGKMKFWTLGSKRP